MHSQFEKTKVLKKKLQGTMIALSNTNSYCDTNETICTDGVCLASPKKRVSFAGTVRLRVVLHVADYSIEELQACWFSRHEMAQINYNVRNLLLRMAQNKLQSGELPCIRGLENQTRERAGEKMKNRKHTIETVLHAYRSQMHSGDYDDMAIADLYRQCSRRNQIRATMRGLADQEAARKIQGNKNQQFLARDKEQQAQNKRQRCWMR